MTPLPSADHRPWALPAAPWVMRQRWHDLLFIHWQVDPAVLRPKIPAALQIDTAPDGSTYLAVVPFHMSGIRPRYLPAVPWLSAFPELNVRVYVRYEDKPGVFFFSLDAANPIAVQIARRFYHLPYFNAQMDLRAARGEYYYRSLRVHRGATPARFRARYAPVGPVYRAAPGSLDEWLTERYCLYAQNGRGNLYRAEIHHIPWGLQPAKAEIQVNELAACHGILLPNTPPLLHFAKFLDVYVWQLMRLK
ncbi:MAG: DUF2071 domain-containing protein [Anaerolineales bacterium]